MKQTALTSWEKMQLLENEDKYKGKKIYIKEDLQLYLVFRAINQYHWRVQ